MTPETPRVQPTASTETPPTISIEELRNSIELSEITEETKAQLLQLVTELEGSPEILQNVHNNLPTMLNIFSLPEINIHTFKEHLDFVNNDDLVDAMRPIILGTLLVNMTKHTSL